MDSPHYPQSFCPPPKDRQVGVLAFRVGRNFSTSVGTLVNFYFGGGGSSSTARRGMGKSGTERLLRRRDKRSDSRGDLISTQLYGYSRKASPIVRYSREGPSTEGDARPHDYWIAVHILPIAGEKRTIPDPGSSYPKGNCRPSHSLVDCVK